MQHGETPREDVAKKLVGVTHMLKCIADEATGASRAEIDVARGILLRVMHETKDAGQRDLSSLRKTIEGGAPPLLPDIGPSETVTEQLPFRDFGSVEVDCAFVFEIVKGDSFSVAVTASSALLEYINVSRSGNTLKLSHRPVISGNAPAPEAKITMPAISRLRQGAASKGRLTGFRSQQPFDLFVSGASTVDLDLAVGDARLEISGSSRVTGNLEAHSVDLVLSGAAGGNLRGSAANLTLSAWGAADIDLTDFETSSATVYLKGASQAIVNVRGRLDAELTGASRLDYSGQPQLGVVSLSGASVLDSTPGTQ